MEDNNDVSMRHISETFEPMDVEAKCDSDMIRKESHLDSSCRKEYKNIEASHDPTCELEKSIKNATECKKAKLETQEIAHSSDIKIQKELESHRMQQLRKALEKTVERCVQSGKLSMFATAFPNTFSKKPKALQAVHKQYQAQLRENINSEIELMFNEERVPELMAELDALVQQSEDKVNCNVSQPAWRPNDNVAESLRPHLMAVKIKQKEKLTDLLQEIENENKKLQEVLLKKRQHLNKTVEKCKSKVEGLVQVAEALDEDY